MKLDGKIRVERLERPPIPWERELLFILDWNAMSVKQRRGTGQVKFKVAEELVEDFSELIRLIEFVDKFLRKSRRHWTEKYRTKDGGVVDIHRVY